MLCATRWPKRWGGIVFASSSLGDNRQTYSGVALSAHRRTLNYLCVTCGHRLYLPLGDKIFEKSVSSSYSICRSLCVCVSVFACLYVSLLCPPKVPLVPHHPLFSPPAYPLAFHKLSLTFSLSLSDMYLSTMARK